jgi:hypothetical protein
VAAEQLGELVELRGRNVGDGSVGDPILGPADMLYPLTALRTGAESTRHDAGRCLAQPEDQRRRVTQFGVEQR